MALYCLFEKSPHWHDKEHQFKIKSNLDEKELLNLGAKKIGHLHQEDRYFRPKKGKNITIRIRQEEDQPLLLVQKKYFKNSINRKITSKIVSDKELQEIKNTCTQVTQINRHRSIFIYKHILIHLDEIENLGKYLEFDYKPSQLEILNSLLEKLKIQELPRITCAYSELMIQNTSPNKRFLLYLHEKIGKFSFGISSAVLTTLGVIVGVNSATSSLLAIISGIISIAIADSCSDALGMYASLESERTVSPKKAIKSAINTFLGKFIFTLTFIIPFLLFPISSAIIISLIWGIILLSLVNIQIAYIREKSIIKTVFINLFITALVIFISAFAGKLLRL